MLYVGPELLMPLASAAVAAAGAALMFGRRVMERLRAAGSSLRRPFARARRPATRPKTRPKTRPGKAPPGAPAKSDGRRPSRRTDPR